MAGEEEKETDGRVIAMITIIALAGIMIPLAAIIGSAAWFPWLLFSVVLLGGGTLAAKYLMDHRHQLRMEEIEMKERILRAERDQLDIADRLLAADEEAERRRLMEGDA